MGKYELNKNLAQMLKGGVIMDVTNAEQAKIAEAAGGLCCYGIGAGAGRYPPRRRGGAYV